MEEYKVKNDTYYNNETPDEMVALLENIRLNHIRVRFHWGNTESGEDWGDVHDIKGRIGRSMGPIRIPILLYNNRSIGGTCILTHCIVKITETRGRKILYQHPKYHTRKTEPKICKSPKNGTSNPNNGT